MRSKLVAVVSVTALLSVAGSALSAPSGMRVGKDVYRTATPVRVQSRAVAHRSSHAARKDALTRALKRGAISRAKYALERAKTLTRLRSVRARYGYVARPAGRDATMILRELFLRRSALRGDDAAAAKSILARPSQPGTEPIGDGYSNPTAAVEDCTAPHICVHYMPSGSEAPAAGDADFDGTPDYAEFARDQLELVWSHEVDTLGYRAPKSDANSPNVSDGNPNAKLDLFIDNIGADGVYGYCTSDDPNEPGSQSYPFYDVSAYCVVDNDYAEPHFGAHTPEENLQVTLAHEFFHAVQFSYDAQEDRWLLEGSAAWMEDEVYDAIDDNYQYLPASAMAIPFIPVDCGFCGQGGEEYGAWLFFRYLSELNGDPAIVREVWEHADGSQAAAFNDMDSLTAIVSVVGDRGVLFRSVFADFGVVNFIPEVLYEEGAAYAQITQGGAPFSSKPHTLTASKKSSGARGIRMLHLTNDYIGFIPGKGVKSAAKLKLELNLPNFSRGPAATLLTFKSDNSVTRSILDINSKGDITKKVAFGKGKVTLVVLVLTNADTDFLCFQGSPFSCQGIPVNDVNSQGSLVGQTFVYKGTVVQ